MSSPRQRSPPLAAAAPSHSRARRRGAQGGLYLSTVSMCVPRSVPDPARAAAAAACAERYLFSTKLALLAEWELRRRAADGTLTPPRGRSERLPLSLSARAGGAGAPSRLPPPPPPPQTRSQLSGYDYGQAAAVRGGAEAALQAALGAGTLGR